MRKILVWLMGVMIATLAGGCGQQEKPEAAKEIVLLCGNSFLLPAQELCNKFTAETGIKVLITAAGSEDFLPLIEAGSKGDALITHDPYLDFVRDKGKLADHAQLGFVAPVLVVAKGNPFGLKGIEDLTKPGLRVGLTDPQYSTCGEMVFALLEKKGIKEEVMKNVGNRLTKGHGNLATMLVTGAVDAGIIWNGVATERKDKLDIVPLPYEYDREVRVHVIGFNYSRHPELVQKFLDFARREGTEIFTKHGFVK